MNGHSESPTTPPVGDADPLDEATAGLAAAVLELAREVSTEALAQPRWFALLATAELLVSQPAFRAVLDEESIERASWDSSHLTPIELEGPVGVTDPLRALEQIELPGIAAGVAVACDLEASSWSDRRAARDSGSAPDDATPHDAMPQDAVPQHAMPNDAMPKDGALRVVAAARTGGGTWCAVRPPSMTEHAVGPRLVPDLVAALSDITEADTGADAGTGRKDATQMPPS